MEALSFGYGLNGLMQDCGAAALGLLVQRSCWLFLEAQFQDLPAVLEALFQVELLLRLLKFL